MNLLNLLALLIYVHLAALFPRFVHIAILALGITTYWFFIGLEVVPFLFPKEIKP